MKVSSTIQKLWSQQKPFDFLNLTSDGAGWRNESNFNLITIVGNQNISNQLTLGKLVWYGQNLK